MSSGSFADRQIVKTFNSLQRHAVLRAAPIPNHWDFSIRHVPLDPPMDVLFIRNPGSNYVHVEAPSPQLNNPNTKLRDEGIARHLLKAFTGGMNAGVGVAFTVPKELCFAPWSWSAENQETANNVAKKFRELGVRVELTTVGLTDKNEKRLADIDWEVFMTALKSSLETECEFDPDNSEHLPTNYKNIHTIITEKARAFKAAAKQSFDSDASTMVYEYPRDLMEHEEKNRERMFEETANSKKTSIEKLQHIMREQQAYARYIVKWLTCQSVPPKPTLKNLVESFNEAYRPRAITLGNSKNSPRFPNTFHISIRIVDRPCILAGLPTIDGHGQALPPQYIFVFNSSSGYTYAAQTSFPTTLRNLVDEQANVLLRAFVRGLNGDLYGAGKKKVYELCPWSWSVDSEIQRLLMSERFRQIGICDALCNITVANAEENEKSDEGWKKYLDVLHEKEKKEKEAKREEWKKMLTDAKLEAEKKKV